MKSTIRKNTTKLCMLLLTSSILLESYSQTLTGKVLDEKGVAIKGAEVKLTNAALSATSGDDGKWSITVPTSIEHVVRRTLLPVPVLHGTILYFAINNKENLVKASVYTLNGKLKYNVVDRKLEPGFYSLNPIEQSLSSNIYVLRIQIGEEISCFRLLVPSRSSQAKVSLLNKTTTTTSFMSGLEKKMVVIDTLRVSKTGYTQAFMPIESYGAGPLTITLKEIVSAYRLNPPNPCYNQFWVDKCIEGDPNSVCGGKCNVANSCSPPEDPSKANLPKTFICPRFMLYSTEMLQAARDDAALYGWANTNGESPFNYGVVGHDADVGGLDDGNSSCCQCYQIVYVKPEPSSPQPPALPYPKPLIVQSFNTAASGTKGFDVFMGAGGYGAFNACYKDAAFSNTSKFNEFIYDQFPYQNPGSGGISFLRCPECIQGWPPTIEGVLSAACQDKIRQLCNQALVNSSAQVTEDTRRSCIQCNKLESLYHQNWDVVVKRVRCPENLTRVTGCRLVEDNLSLPLPKVQTPSDATANGTFRTGYHTTTMQDCCKPTCAWANWTTGAKLPVDGEWNSFYSCDKNGIPFTK